MTQLLQTTDTARHYSRAHAERFRHELHDLLRIPSISTDSGYAHEVARAAEWLASHLDVLGAPRMSRYCQLPVIR